MMRRLFFVCVCFLCVGLGGWQLQRLAWKKNLIEERERRFHLLLPRSLADASENAFFRIRLRGVFHHERETFLQGRRQENLWGADVITPFRLTTGEEILVHRGWVSLDEKKILPRPKGWLLIEGILTPIPQFTFWKPANVPSKGEWYWIDPKALSPKGFQKIYLIAQSPSVPVLRMVEALPPLPERHLGYALTWFALAFFAFFFAFPPAPFFFSRPK
ncbi:MAG: SURF1 family protein [Holosporales bacterium]